MRNEFGNGTIIPQMFQFVLGVAAPDD